MNKALEMLKVAYATYQRNEPEIASDICVLALEDPSAAQLLADDAEAHRAKAVAALRAGQYDDAIQHIESVRAMEDDVEDDVDPSDLAPQQVASIVALARQIKTGHPDLAQKITEALGL